MELENEYGLKGTGSLPLYAGIDGGGSKTQVLLMDTDETRILSVFGGATNPNTVGWETAVQVVVALVTDGLKELGHSEHELQGLCAAMAGMDRPKETQKMVDSLREVFPRAEIQLVNDALAALSAGTSGGSGVVLIAGTGSIAVGETKRGSVYRSGGYGYLIGDEGSGFDIGRLGLIAAISGYEKRGPTTELWNAAVDFFRVLHPQELIPKVYSDGHSVGRVASFAKEVLTLADVDTVASQIIDGAISHYQSLVESVFAQAAEQGTHYEQDLIANHVVLAGGLFVGHTSLSQRLQECIPDRRFTVLKHSPASGGVLRALLRHGKVRGSTEEEKSASVTFWESLVTQYEQESQGL